MPNEAFSQNVYLELVLKRFLSSRKDQRCSIQGNMLVSYCVALSPFLSGNNEIITVKGNEAMGM